MSRIDVFRCYNGDLAVIVGEQLVRIRDDQAEEFYGKVGGALPVERRRAVRPIEPAQQVAIP